jgi:hypothetical protein
LFVVKSKDEALANYKKNFGDRSKLYFEIEKSLIEKYGFNSISVINPMLTESVSEEQIINDISKLGWVKPKDTGLNSSNCQLNDLGIFLHHKKYGFNPYILEIAEQVRFGLMTKEKAKEKINAVPAVGEVTKQAEKIGIKID